MILHEISRVVSEGKEAKAKGDENRVIELRKEYKQLSAELKIASRYAAKGNAFNQAEIDLKADPMLVNKFLKESEKLTFNGVEVEITGVEFQNNKGLTLNECKSVPATLLKRTEGMVLEACEQIVINFIDIVTEVKNGRMNIFSKDVVKELGVLPMDKAKNDNMYKIAVSLMRDYNMEIKNVMDRFNDENSIVDTDDERKEAIKHVTDEYKKMLGDMAKDPVLAYYALVAVYDKMYSRYQSLVERVFNSESDMIKNDVQTNKLLMSQDMIERTKDYVMANGDSRLGEIEITDGEFRYVNYKNFMVELVSGTSFPYSALTEGMLNLVPTVDLEAPNGVESVIVNEDNEMILIRSGFDSRVSNLQFIAEKEVKDEDTKDRYNIINLQSGIYEVISGMVTIPKEVNKFDFVFEADRTIPTGQYAIRYNKESNAVILNNKGEIFVVDKLSRVLYNSNKMKVNGEFVIFVKNVDGCKFSLLEQILTI